MIRHCVFLNLRADHDASELADVFSGLSALCDSLAGAQGFWGGPNIDLERKSQDYPSGFTIDFDDSAALQRYAEDPTHKALGGRLVAQCNGGADGIVVFDIQSPA